MKCPTRSIGAAVVVLVACSVCARPSRATPGPPADDRAHRKHGALASTPCGPSGATVTIHLAGVDDVAGVRLSVRYPRDLSIPGSGAGTAPSRFTDVRGGTATSAIVDVDTDGDGVDDAIRIVYARPGREPIVGDAFQLQFDCKLGAPVRRSDFTCVVEQASDPDGGRLDGIDCSISAIR